MAVPALVKQLGNTGDKAASSTTLNHTFTGTVAAGNTIIARIVFDNAAVASKPIVSSIGKMAGETANWVLLGAARSTSTTAGAFASGEMWAIQTTVNWSAAAYTVTFDTAITQKAVSFAEWFGLSATARSTAGTAYSTTTTAASATTTGTTPVINDVALGFIFGSNVAAAQAGDNDTTGGSWSTPVSLGTTGGNVATNNFGIMQYKVLTSASHQTLNNSAVMTAGNGAIVAILQSLPEPSITQAAYQFFDDAGTESGAASLAAANTAITGNLGNGDGFGVLRVRLQVTANAGFATDDYQLQWEKNASGTWTNVATTGTTVISYDNPNLTDAAATTNRLGAGTGSFVAGKISETGVASDVRITTTNYTELVYALKLLAANFTDGDTLRFRVLRNAATTGMTYTQVPTINVVRIVTQVIATRATTWNTSGRVTATRNTTWNVAETSGLLFETLTDTFDTTIDTTTKWTKTASTVWEIGGVNVPSTDTAQYIRSRTTYTLTGSYVFAKVRAPAVSSGNRYSYMMATPTGSGTDFIAINSSVLGFYIDYEVGGSYTQQTSIALDPIAHAWWRIRESGGTIYCETSPDSQTWTVLGTLAWPSVWTAKNFYVEFTTQDPGGASAAASLYIDNVNVAVPVGAHTFATSGGTSCTVATPAHSPGDLLVWFMGNNQGQASPSYQVPDASAGAWVLAGQATGNYGGYSPNVSVYLRTAGPSEPSTFQCNSPAGSGGQNHSAAMIAVSGADAAATAAADIEVLTGEHGAGPLNIPGVTVPAGGVALAFSTSYPGFGNSDPPASGPWEALDNWDPGVSLRFTGTGTTPACVIPYGGGDTAAALIAIAPRGGTSTSVTTSRTTTWNVAAPVITSFSDNFNRADGALGSSWAALGGIVAPVISSNHVIVTGTGNDNAATVVGLTGTNQWGRLAASLGPDYSEAGVLLHATDSVHTFLFTYVTDGEPYGPGVFGATNGPALQVYVLYAAGPQWRFLAETPGPASGTHVLYGVNVGRRFQYWFDGVLVFDVDDSAHSEIGLVGEVGFTIHRATAGTETIVDDFAGGVFTTAAPTITSFAPSSALPGATVTVTGTNLVADATMFTIAGYTVPVTVTSPTTGTFVVPAGPADSWGVSIGTPAGYAYDSFTILASTTPVTTSRATTWNVRQVVTSARATTWRVLTSVSTPRATTWRVLASVSTLRATTWQVAAIVTTARATTWQVAGSLSFVSTLRATTWNTRAALSVTRPTTWNTRAAVSVTRPTTWVVRSVATTARATTWKVLSGVSTSRATTWNVLFTSTGLFPFYDDFERADGDPGANYEVVNGGLAIASGKLVGTTAGWGQAYITPTPTSADQYVEYTCNVPVAYGGVDAYLRCSGPGLAFNGYVVWWYWDGGGTFQVGMGDAVAGGSGTQGVTLDVAKPTAPFTIRGEIIGTTYRLLLNGTLLDTGTVTAYSATGRMAFDTYDNSGGFESLSFGLASVTTPVTTSRSTTWNIEPLFWKGTGVITDWHPNVATDLATIKAGWWYDWTNYQVAPSRPGVYNTGDIQYIPMIWGDWISDPRLGPPPDGWDLGDGPYPGTDILLGFNEPDDNNQSRMSVSRALELWPQLEATGARLGSPAGTGGSSSWLADFMDGDGAGYVPRVDFICLHFYPGLNGSMTDFANYIDYMHGLYNRPVWITEFSALYGDVATNAALVDEFMAICLARPWIERVAWFILGPFPEFPGTKLVEDTGALTATGAVYDNYEGRIVRSATTTSVSTSRSTTWRVLSGVTTARATTWVVRAPVTTLRATTWVVRAAITNVRVATWNTYATAQTPRPTTWNTRATATVATPTTWRVLVPVAGTVARSTTWVVRTSVSTSRATTWAAAQGVLTSRATTWNVAGSLTFVSTSRATTWLVNAPVAAARATTWQVLATLATPAIRPTTWRVLSSVTSTRATTWNVAASVSSNRPTTWAVLVSIPVARPTTWNVRAQVSVTRPTTWNVAGSLNFVTTSRATTWGVRAIASTNRQALWTVCTPVSTLRPTTWAVLRGVTPVARATTWKVDAQVTTARASSWNVAGSIFFVQTSRAATWHTLRAVTANRATTWGAYQQVMVLQTALWRVMRTAATLRQARWNVAAPIYRVTVVRSTTWNVAPSAPKHDYLVLYPNTVMYLGEHLIKALYQTDAVGAATKIWP